MLLMVSKERELLVGVGIPSAADVDTKTGIRADSAIFGNIILVPNFEAPEPQIIETPPTLCQIPTYVEPFQNSSGTKR